MRIALIDSHKNPVLYSIALLKIAAWRKSIGDKCIYYTNRLPEKSQKFDEIWITTLFTFEIPHVRGLIKEAKKRAKIVRVGGVAATLMPEYFKRDNVELHKGLIPEAEACRPDYGILPEKLKYIITHTSRGCVRKCDFCMVHILEPKFINRHNWVEDILEGTQEILFYDNNWLAKPLKYLNQDAKLIKNLQKKGVRSVDFNQGLDCRLLTKEKADMLQGIKINPVRFAFDWMAEDGHFQKAIKMMNERGYKEFVNYVLYNYKDTPEDLYYRIRTCAELAKECMCNVKAFPMKYQPIKDINSKNFVGENWTKKMIENFKLLLKGHSPQQVIACTPSRQGNKSDKSAFRGLYEFEYWFGKNEKDFIHILNSPIDLLKELTEKKRANIRYQRAKSRND